MAKKQRVSSTVSSWGNSLGLRIPKALAEIIGIEDGSKVDVELKNGSLVISPVNSDVSTLEERIKHIDLNKLVLQINKNNRHELLEDEPIGREVW